MLDRALKRLDDGTYGRSVRSGQPIPDERLEAESAAELTVQEAAAAREAGPAAGGPKLTTAPGAGPRYGSSVTDISSQRAGADPARDSPADRAAAQSAAEFLDAVSSVRRAARRAVRGSWQTEPLPRRSRSCSGWPHASLV